MPDDQRQDADTEAVPSADMCERLVAPEGCWLTAGWDMNWYDVRPHASEIEALRYAAREPYMGRGTFFVPFGEELHDRHRIRASDG
jgi:hypothetical protein